jgi:hypothetical protein
MLTKTEIHEFLGRDVDEIEDLRRYFESSWTETYSNPTDGDFISDDYFKVIDLTTQPGKLSEREARSLNRAVEHLNEVYPTIERRLGKAGMLDIYQDVMGQVNALNAADPTRSSEIAGVILPPLRPSVETSHTQHLAS